MCDQFVRAVGRSTAIATILISSASVVLAQPQSPSASAPPPITRRLTLDDAVRLALEQNLGIKIERYNPQIEDLSVAQARGLWTPVLNSTFQGTHSNTPSTNLFSGGLVSIIGGQVSTGVGVSQSLKTGTSYALAWNGSRATSTNPFNSYNPLVSSGLTFNITQPLLRNFKIDTIRQQVETSMRDRDASDLDLQATIAQTTRSVSDAYWDLTYQIDNLHAFQQSLDLTRELLSDNEKRVQAGTMASLDIVEAQSEVARNEELVIVADSAMRQAEDNLRVLIFDPDAPDFWTVSIEPIDVAPFQAQRVDLDAAVRHALDARTDIRQIKNTMARDDVNIRYFQNQTLPEVNAQASYTGNAVGGVGVAPPSYFPFALPIAQLPEAGFPSVVGTALTGGYPTWSVGVTVGYPIGKSPSEASLARAKLQSSQAATQLKNLELQVVAQVRNVARQVETNQKRVDTTRAARELAERRLEVEQRKFAAGVQTNFFVFQAQRDLSQARVAEAQATADYNKSLADFEAVQLAPPLGR